MPPPSGLLRKQFLHAIGNLARLGDDLFGQCLQLFAIFGIDLELARFDIGQEPRISHGFAKRFAQYFQTLGGNRRRRDKRPAEVT